MLKPGIAIVLWVGLAAPAAAQTAPAPTVSAEDTQWFQLREPIYLFGYEYLPSGPTVYFDANVMRPAATYDRIPVYMDATIEPFSVVLVPAGRGMLRPYERRRTGDLAGTTGSRTPSFPIDPGLAPGNTSGVPAYGNIPQVPFMAAGASPLTRNVPQAPAPTAAAGPALRDVPQAAPPSGPAALPPPPLAPAAALPQVGTSGRGPSTLRVSMTFDGARWDSAGKAEPFTDERFYLVGEYRGFPVFRHRADLDGRLVYVPTLAGFVAPFRRAEEAR
jgi:hypothetical protein